MARGRGRGRGRPRKQQKTPISTIRNLVTNKSKDGEDVQTTEQQVAIEQGEVEIAPVISSEMNRIQIHNSSEQGVKEFENGTEGELNGTITEGEKLVTL